MANHASTDEIAIAAFNASKKYWKEFIAFPIVVTLVIALFIGVIINFSTNPTGLGALAPTLTLALWVFWITYLGAQVKWCEEIHKGAKSIDIQEGMKFGFSRFWGILGTGFLTMIKIILWSLLLILPGMYKGLMYSKSIHVSILDKISGGDANRISEAIIQKAGPIRSFSNLMGIAMLSGLATYILLAVAMLLGFISGAFHEYAAIFILALVYGIGISFITTVTYAYYHFEYLYFRDEAKAEITKLKKAFS